MVSAGKYKSGLSKHGRTFHKDEFVLVCVIAIVAKIIVIFQIPWQQVMAGPYLNDLHPYYT
jgi:hypothetical protein